MGLKVYREIPDGLQIIGELAGNTRADASFCYDAGYLEGPDAQPISYSLPLADEPYGPEATRPYFDGLLPEGPSRQLLAAETGCREDDYPTLLARCGLDCVGDIIINPEAYEHERAYERVELVSIVSKSRRSRGVARMQAESRLSIAGVQGKTGLYHDETRPIDEGWFTPVGGAPSNYIAKFANEYTPDLIELEYLCMAAARSSGVNVAPADLLLPETPVLCVRRFDRALPSRETIGGLTAPVRLHQEDMAQALGIAPGSKYAELEPCTISAVASFLVDHSANPALDITALTRLILFNYVIGNCDNHLKNISIIYTPNWSAIRLAPAYDLISTAHYPSFSTEMGMRLGNTRTLENVTSADIRELARQIGISENVVRNAALEIAEEAVPALKRAASVLDSKGFADALYLADELEEEFGPRIETLKSC